MAVPGIRNIADARQRLMANPESQAAWASLDCGFATVADVFDECYLAAKRIIANEELTDFLEAARLIGKLGRGAEPLLAILEHWPHVVDVIRLPQTATLPLLMNAVRSLQKSPNGPAVTPLLQTLGAVATRLRQTYGNDADKISLAANLRPALNAALLNLRHLYDATRDPQVLQRLFTLLEQSHAAALADAPATATSPRTHTARFDRSLPIIVALIDSALSAIARRHAAGPAPSIATEIIAPPE